MGYWVTNESLDEIEYYSKKKGFRTNLTVKHLVLTARGDEFNKEPSFPRLEPTSLRVEVGRRIILTRNFGIKARLYRGKLGTGESWAYQSGLIEIFLSNLTIIKA